MKLHNYLGLVYESLEDIKETDGTWDDLNKLYRVRNITLYCEELCLYNEINIKNMEDCEDYYSNKEWYIYFESEEEVLRFLSKYLKLYKKIVELYSSIPDEDKYFV